MLGRVRRGGRSSRLSCVTCPQRTDIPLGTQDRQVSNRGMPLYFFHIRKGEDFIRDDEGGEFGDLEAAQAEAALSCRDLAVQEMRDGGFVTYCNVEIWDESGNLLDTVHTRAIIDGPSTRLN